MPDDSGSLWSPAMNENVPPSPAPASTPAPNPAPQSAPPTARRRPWLLYGCGGIVALLLIIAATVAITVWYIQRPIKPVVLSPEEKSLVEAKLNRVSDIQPATDKGAGLPRGPATATAEGQVLKVAADNPKPVDSSAKPAPTVADRIYTPGSKELRLTEREINGLLNANTDLGNTVRLEFARDAINAYIAAPIPDDVPVLGGKMFRARGRFRVSIGNDATPFAVLEDVTVFGLSLPKAWLGGIKGENLLSDAMGKHNGRPALRGVKQLRVEPGALVLEVED